jgi:tetratricopeptide (TPR) repeat protein
MTHRLIWNEDDVQRLLQHPAELLNDTQWRLAISAVGGIETVYDHLRTFPLKDKQQALLEILTTYPGASVDMYCNLLHVHPATFHRHQRTLFRSLATFLNSMNPAGDAQPASRLPRSARALHQLRTPAADFIGREAETTQLLAALRTAAPDRPAPALGAIHGMGGVGKTELATWIAQQLIDHFPDAQLLVSLHGTRETPITPVQGLQTIIQVLTRESTLPGDLESLEALYRSCLHGKRVLVLVDDVRDPAHVYPWIPPAGSALLVTSRQRFVLPGMVHVQLGDLPADQSTALAQQICPRLGVDEAQTLARACGGLPLALRTSASILANNPALPVATYLRRLADVHQRLAVLRDPDDPYLNVGTSLDLSYVALDPPVQQTLRHLSLLVADFATPLALAVLADLGDGEAEEHLYLLMRRNLLMYDPIRSRWRMHDLVRSLALKKAEAANEAEAVRWRYAQASVEVVRILRDGFIAGGDDGLKHLIQFDLERPHLDAAWQWAFNQAGTPAASRILIAAALATQRIATLRYSPQPDRHQQLSAALAAARHLGERAAEGELLWYLGNIEFHLGNSATALTMYREAYAILNDVGEEYKAAVVNFDSANVAGHLSGIVDHHAILAIYQQSLETFRRLNAPLRMISTCINNIATEYHALNNHEMALDYLEQALAIAKECGDHVSMARALFNIGYHYGMLGEMAPAFANFEQSLAMIRMIGMREGEAIILNGMAETYARMGEYDRAGRFFEEALAIFRSLENRGQEAATQWDYGLMLMRQGEREQGLARLRASLAYKVEHNDRSLLSHQALLARFESGDLEGLADA